MRWLLLIALMLPAAAQADDKAKTLADVKVELATLAAEFTTLKQELVTTRAATTGAAGADPLKRMDAIEAELTKLTAKTEAVQQKLDQVVADGTNRIGDIEFRLCELTKGCDPTKLPTTPDLGALAAEAVTTGAATTTTTAPATASATTTATTTATTAATPDMAVNEQADFDRAQAVLDSSDFHTAADLFATYAQTYPGGALAQKAGVRRGDALTKLGDTAKAARSYLDAFSGAPQGTMAGEALTKLGQALGKLGQKPEACVTLAEVGKRFPGSADATNAATAMQGLGCS